MWLTLERQGAAHGLCREEYLHQCRKSESVNYFWYRASLKKGFDYRPCLAALGQIGHNSHMRRTSLADAKAHLSELVDQAEHHGKRIMILRHGKPAAALVPVEVIAAKRPKPLSEQAATRSLQAFIAEFSMPDASTSAVDDLLQGRR